MSAAQPVTRAREQPAGEEEASSELKLGEFDGVHSLTHSEARLLINTIMTHRQDSVLEDNDVFKKTMDYLNLFARYKNSANIAAIEQILATRPQLQPFEKSQLANLAIQTEQDDEGSENAAQQAKHLIPSLTDKISDEDLLQLLEDLEKLRTSGSE